MALQLNHQNNLKTTKGASTTSVAPTSAWAEFLSLLKSIGIFLGIAFLLRASVVEAFKIPSESMVPTLETGDHILVNKLSYGFRLPLVDETVFQFGEPRRGDVVVFTLPDDPATPDVDESDTNIIKRVMGLPGDTLEVHGMKVYINNRQVDEPYTQWLEGGRKSFGPIPIPAGKVLMLGDNRDKSRDSRYWTDPFLDIHRIKGRAFVIYWNSRFLFNRIFNIIR